MNYYAINANLDIIGINKNFDKALDIAERETESRGVKIYVVSEYDYMHTVKQTEALKNGLIEEFSTTRKSQAKAIKASNAETLVAMAEMVEAKDIDNEFEELVEIAKYTAEMNPVSETAEDLISEMLEVLRQLR